MGLHQLGLVQVRYQLLRASILNDLLAAPPWDQRGGGGKRRSRGNDHFFARFRLQPGEADLIAQMHLDESLWPRCVHICAYHGPRGKNRAAISTRAAGADDPGP